MKNAISPQSCFAMLFDPTIAQAAAERAAQWDLPRRVCRPLDRRSRTRVSADLAAYDAAVEMAPVAEEEMREEPPGSMDAGIPENDSDFEDTDEF